jgi:hypothetical protein
MEKSEPSLKITNLADCDWDARRAQAQAEFPLAKYGSPLDVSQSMLVDFEKAIEADSEEAIQRMLTAHPYALQYAIEGSGHHGTWVFPKQMIKPPGADGRSGLIPDFLVATSSSLGYFWHVIELKKAADQFANSRGDAMSRTANTAVTQCNGYLAHFADYIDSVRGSIGLSELVQPRGAILLMGDARLESDRQRERRAQFDNSGRISVVTYDRIRRGIMSDLGYR